jgi:hypothetical protein
VGNADATPPSEELIHFQMITHLSGIFFSVTIIPLEIMLENILLEKTKMLSVLLLMSSLLMTLSQSVPLVPTLLNALPLSLGPLVMLMDHGTVLDQSQSAKLPLMSNANMLSMEISLELLLTD